MNALLAILLTIMIVFSLSAPAQVSAQSEPKLIYFAGGCFWGIEHMMAMVPGVVDAVSGYANGTTENPDYYQVTSGKTGHRETVRVAYDPSLVTLEELLTLYFETINPTVKNRQGNDIGSQYQTGVYYTNEADGETVKAFAEEEKAKYKNFEVEIGPLTSFWEAEDYHQDYLVKNPGGYCHITQEDFELARNTGKAPSPESLRKIAEYRKISPEDAKAAIDSGTEVIIVDVREPYEFESGHIKDAVNLPSGSIASLAEEQLPDKDAMIYLYCRSGARSRAAAMQLVNMGYTNLYDLGGIINWPYDIVK